MTKHIEARNLLEATGNEAAAWEIAKSDEGMLPGVTINQWLAVAYAGIARDNAMAASYKDAYFA